MKNDINGRFSESDLGHGMQRESYFFAVIGEKEQKSDYEQYKYRLLYELSFGHFSGL